MIEDWKRDICERDIAEATMALAALDQCDGNVPTLNFFGATSELSAAHVRRLNELHSISYFANALFDDAYAATREARFAASWPRCKDNLIAAIQHRAERQKRLIS